MKTPLLILSLLLITTNAYAEWTFYGETADGDVGFYDKSSVKRNGNKVKVWNYVNVSPNDEQAKSRNMGSARALNEIDCVNETTKKLSFSSYTRPNLQGEVRYAADPNTRIVYIPPGSIYATLMKVVCEK